MIQQKSGGNAALLLFPVMSFGSASRLFMSAFYTLAGLALLFTNVLVDTITTYRMLIGGVLVGYGVLRFVLWKQWKDRHHRSEDRP
ncbi:MAG TPA: hypothetical protein PKJ19_08715 [Flavobacteriales bacterium]|nr:hypothetical protein [Flavobacteriales bacterium]HNU56755.1 hypothetical protein [Flavobacteriales bacterium]